MAKLSKHMLASKAKIEAGKHYAFNDAVTLLKDCRRKKFNESVDMSINLGVNPRKSDQMVRGSTVLPNGSGKSVRVAVLTQGAKAEAAAAAGADLVGFNDLAESIQGGTMDFDVLIASPDAMAVVGRLGPILGPRGLMPNPKVGTVTPDVATAVKNAKAGQVQYRTDKNGIIHCTIGKASFDAKQLRENLAAVVANIVKAKPSASKGVYLKKITLSTTMGPSVTLDQSTIGEDA